MGCCQSTGSAMGAVNRPPTAKVITLAGILREYSTPVAAFDVLGGDSAACFLCSSDRLYCDDYITALHPEELLQAGQIYFVLPATKLWSPLSGKDMAALAMKANLALALSLDRSRRTKMVRVTPAPDGSTGCSEEEVKRTEEKVGRGSTPPAVVVQRKMKRSRSVRRRAAYRYYRYPRSRLSTIPELVE